METNYVESEDGGRTGHAVELFGRTLSIAVAGHLGTVAARRGEVVGRGIVGRTTEAVDRLNRTGSVESVHLARLLDRAEEYRQLDDRFDVRRGEGRVVTQFPDGEVGDDGRFDAGDPGGETGVVVAEGDVDLPAMTTGYAVDRIVAALDREGRTVQVVGDGLAARGRGLAVEGPTGETHAVLDSEWAVATTGEFHAPDGLGIRPAEGDVVVLARRDATEADALATVLDRREGRAALTLARDLDGVEALTVANGSIRETDGTRRHFES